MPIDYGVLKTEIATDPDSLGYAGKNSVLVAALLNTPGNLLDPAKAGAGWTKPQPLVPIADVLIWAATADGATVPMATIVTGAATPTDPLYGVCLAADRMLQGGVTALDVSNPSVIAMIGALEAAGKITANQQAALIALGLVPCSRAEALFGVGVLLTPDDVQRA